MEDYEKEYEDFWKDIIENKDGSINLDQLKRELFDYSYLINNIPKLYDEITGSCISKPNTHIKHVIQKVNERISDAYQEGFDEASEYIHD